MKKILLTAICVAMISTGCGGDVGDVSVVQESSTPSVNVASSIAADDVVETEQAGGEDESTVKFNLAKAEILSANDHIFIGGMPIESEIGTQAELDKWIELVTTSEVWRIAVASRYDLPDELTVEDGNAMLEILANSVGDIQLYDVLPNPSTGGSVRILAFDKDDNFIYRVIFYGNWLDVVFVNDGMNKGYIFNGEDSELADLNEYF